MQSLTTPATVYSPEALATVFRQLLDENYTDVNRLWKGAEIVERGEYRWLSKCGRWAFVASNGRQEYLVGSGTCSCPDRQSRGVVCKHLAAAEMLRRLQTPEPTEPASFRCPACAHSYPTGAEMMACFDSHAAPLTCPRCHKAPTSEISARAIRSDGACCRCLNDELYGPDDAA